MSSWTEYALIGKSLSHSFSEKIHALLGNENYSLLSLNENELEEFFLKKKFLGVNVTIPYKKSVIKYLNYLSPTAEKTGVVNTVVNEDGKLKGYNTDYFGFIDSVNRNFGNIKDKTALILGSGASSESVRLALNSLGVEKISKVSRKGELNYGNVYEEEADIIVNTTPVGMYPDNSSSLIDLSRFKKCNYVFDLVYNPFYTKLLYDARALNKKYVNGMDMLISQAIKSHELFFNTEVDLMKKEEIRSKLYCDSLNIVLTGMPGCGKSVVAKELSKLLKRKVIDTDDEIERINYLSIEEIFELKGEAYFRKEEEKLIDEISKEHKIIISTGGGSILSKANRFNLKANGFIVLLDRDINKLSKFKRPLSENINALKKIKAERENIYNSFCDIRIENDTSTEKCADRIRSEFYESFGNKRP